MNADDLEIGIRALLTDWTRPIEQAKADAKDLGATTESAMKRAGDAMDKAANSTKKHAKATDDFGGALHKLGEGFRPVNAGLSVLGLNADAAAVKLDALVQVFEGLGKAAGPMLGIGAGIAVGALVFEGVKKGVEAFVDTLKEAVNEAGRRQLAMTELKNVTVNQGGDWTVAGKQIEAWLETAAGISGFTRGELVQGLKQLGDAGKYGADGITYQRTAMELARATGISLAQAEAELTGASYDMGRGLIALGVLRRQDIKDGMTQAQMLDAVHDRVKGAAEAFATTLPGALARVRAEWMDLLDALGTPFLGAISSVLNATANFVTNMRAGFEKAIASAKKFAADNNDALSLVSAGFRALFDTIYGIVVAGWTLISGAFNVAMDVLHGNWGKAWLDIGKTLDDAMSGFLRAFGVWGENMVTTAIFIADRIRAALSTAAHVGIEVMTGNYLGAEKDAIAGVASEVAAIRRGPMLKTVSAAGGPLAGDAASSLRGWLTTQLGDLFKQRPTLQHDQRIHEPDKHDHSSHDAEEKLKNLQDRISDWLEAFEDRATAAQDAVKRAQDDVDRYKGTLPGGKPQNAAQGAHEKELEDALAAAQLAAAAASNNRAVAEAHAAKVLRDYAASISSSLANADDLRRAARQAARTHTRAAGAAVETRDTSRDSAQKTTNQGVIDLLDGIRQNAASSVEVDKATFARETDNTELQIAEDQNRAAGTNATPESTAALDVEIARLRDQLAIDAEALAKHSAEALRAAADASLSAADIKAADEADAAAAKATIARTNADTAYLNTQSRLVQIHDKLGESLTKLIEKLNIPGLSVQQGVNGGIAASFNPMAFLLSAFEQTKSFADIMQTVNGLMKVFAEILDLLKPIIDSLLQAIGFVANIFIDLYDTIAQLLRIFGIHIQLLDRINTNFDALNGAFVSIVHDIPTLNELATGNIAPLSTTPKTYSDLQTIQQPTIDALNSPDLGGGLLSVLGNILEAVLAIKLASALFGGGSGGGILGSISGLFSGNGIFGSIGKLFGLGGSSSANAAPGANLVDDLGAADAAPGGGGASTAALAGTVSTVLSILGITAAGIGIANAVTGGKGSGLAEGAGAIIGLGAAGAISLGGGALGLGDLIAGVGLGPIGIGAAIIGAIGGGMLFGNHFSAKDEPDQNLPGYQSWLSGYNGQQAGNQATTLEQDMAGIDPSKLSGQALADYQQLKALGGASGNLGIAHEKDDVFSIGGGGQDQVEDFIALTTRALTEFANGFASTITGALGNLGSAAQDLTQSISAAGNDLVGQVQGAAAGAAANVAAAVTNITTGNVAINTNVNYNGDLNGDQQPDELAAMHGNAIDRALSSRRYSLANAVPL